MRAITVVPGVRADRRKVVVVVVVVAIVVAGVVVVVVEERGEEGIKSREEEVSHIGSTKPLSKPRRRDVGGTLMVL